MVAVMVMVINARDPTRARACVSPGGGRASLGPDTAARLPAWRPIRPVPGAVCRRCRGLSDALATAFVATHLISQRNI